MTRQCRLLSMGVVVAGVAWGVWLAGGELQAQGRGGGAWTTVGGDAQRTSSVQDGCRRSPSPACRSPGFQFLWKRKLGARPQSLTQPILLPNIIAYKGFKALAFVGGSADNVYAVDYDLNRMFWEQHLATGSDDRGDGRVPAAASRRSRRRRPLRRPRRAAGGAEREEAAAVRAVRPSRAAAAAATTCSRSPAAAWSTS